MFILDPVKGLIPMESRTGWIGFIPAGRLGKTPSNASVLVVATRKMASPDPTHFEGGPFPKPINGNWPTWVIRYDASWSSSEVWRERLRPFFEATASDDRQDDRGRVGADPS